MNRAKSSFRTLQSPDQRIAGQIPARKWTFPPSFEIRTPKRQAATSRVYTAISEVVDQISPRAGEDDPAPEVVIDDTVGEQDK